MISQANGPKVRYQLISGAPAAANNSTTASERSSGVADIPLMAAAVCDLEKCKSLFCSPLRYWPILRTNVVSQSCPHLNQLSAAS
jgi:hypothetical protein